MGAWKTQSYTGAAYIFKNNLGTWIEDQVIVASDGSTMDDFGWSVAISGDYIIVGADKDFEDENGNNSINRAGSAYIFKNNSGNWSQVKKLVASDREASDLFGYSVSISGDYAIVGAPNEDNGVTGTNAGSAYIFKNTSGVWGQVQKIVASTRSTDAYFGQSVAILKIVASTRSTDAYFGQSVAILNEYALVGSYGEDTGAGATYIFSDPSATPVELVSFEGFNAEEGVLLSWQTATEVNNYGFQVQRTKDKVESDGQWEDIGFVHGNGTTNSPKDYEFTDSELPIVDEVSYRLKQIDNDGTFTYSKTITVDLKTITSVENQELPTVYSLEQNYPNPFNPTTTIKFALPESGLVNLVVFNMLGQEVASLISGELQTGYYEISFGNSKLSSGLYVYRIDVEGKFSSVKKMLLVK